MIIFSHFVICVNWKMESGKWMAALGFRNYSSDWGSHSHLGTSDWGSQSCLGRSDSQSLVTTQLQEKM